MKTIRITGVPEHFNLPWHLAMEEGAFEKRGIDLQWADTPEGTGKMCQMLREGTTDMAIILTEGIVKDITAGNPSKIVQTYIETPLIWGIHVAAGSPYQKTEALENTKVAISRFGSGSHLMSFVNARNMGWDINTLKFEVINTIEGAVDALTAGNADYFMWERFMTKPLVDQEIFRRIGDCPTPWPCFVIAVRNGILEKDRNIVKHILEVINTYTADFKQIPSIDRTLANRFDQKTEDIREWLTLTEWSQDTMSPETLKTVQDQLSELDLIPEKLSYEKVVSPV
ncbi:substrate-binding domain-containing protein [Sinomicrobium weinanense]|uniref:ABC transporter substrate-binding protein n=1 Tax=Sinomicrobium weinanense TaxID=2842200 RepID=A0A926Q2D5_9FLAO|nr:substrate-binding domain-containing protein [Sinomicrobium weinanense]MBC9796403.1 ABC transporter substrate-binding protein [Sinomicrobium weinanense]MBU3122596.1 ABC transporter substrate-binding protein [Sinomicrobium weinanense]